MSIDAKFKLPYKKHLPTLTKQYETTPENVEKIANKVSKLYGFFLTPEAHDTNRSLCKNLRSKQVALAMNLSHKHFPTEQEKLQFEEKLKSGIIQSLHNANQHGELKARIDMDYSPISSILETAIDHLNQIQHAHLLLPSKSRSSIVIENGQVILDIDLTCPY